MMIKKVNNTTYVELKKDTLRGFILKTNSKDVSLERDTQYNIIKVIIDNKFKIKIGDKVKVDLTNFHVNKIKQLTDCYYCIQENRTTTMHYILPVLGYNINYFNIPNNLYNVYITKDYTKLVLLYLFSNSPEYLQLEYKLINTPTYVKTLNPTPQSVGFVFNIPKEFLKDIYLILQGKYSDINLNLKKKIYTFHNLSINSKTYNILFNVKEYKKKLETQLGCIIPNNISLGNKPNLNNEIWEIYLKKYYQLHGIR